jgi:hypothetical protein
MRVDEIEIRDIDLVQRLKEAGAGPTWQERDRYGKQHLLFFVDDCDDRYVEVTSSVSSGDYLFVSRDGKQASAYVFETVGVLVAGVVRQLELLAAGRRG